MGDEERKTQPNEEAAKIIDGVADRLRDVGKELRPLITVVRSIGLMQKTVVVMGAHAELLRALKTLRSMCADDSEDD